MNDFYTQEELNSLGFQSLGEDVRLSRKACIYGAENMLLGSHVRIDDFCILSGHIQLGSYIHVAAYTALYGGDDGIFVEDFANLSSRICVYSVSDDYSGETMTNPMIPAKYKNIDSRPVHIGRHVIIGSGSIVLPGVTIAEGGSFGALSLINHDSEAWTINAGIPFRKIRERSRNLLKLEQQLFLRMGSEASQ